MREERGHDGDPTGACSGHQGGFTAKKRAVGVSAGDEERINNPSITISASERERGNAVTIRRPG
jgi:hypothetical protein